MSPHGFDAIVPPVKPTRAVLLVLLATGLWGSSGYFIRQIALPAPLLAWFRMAVPAAAIAAWFLIRGHLPARDGLRPRLIASSLNVVRMVLYFIAFNNTTVANSVIMLYTWPIFASVFGWLMLGERVAPKQAVLLLIAFSGVPVMYAGTSLSLGDRDVIGMTAMLASAVIYSISVILLKRAKAGGSPFETPFFQNLVGAVVFLPLPILTTVPISGGQVWWAIGYGLVVGVAGFTLFFSALHSLPAAVASNMAYAEVVWAVLLSALVLREPVGITSIIGGVLIVCSLVLSTVGGRRSAASA